MRRPDKNPRGSKPFNPAFERLEELKPKVRHAAGAGAAADRQLARQRQAPVRSDSPRELPAPASEAELFRREAGAVAALAPDHRVAPRRRAAPAPRRDPDAEALAELDALVSGHGSFDLCWTDEHIEGIATGVDRRMLRQLRKGGYSVAAHLDLHGATREEARDRVRHFLTDCRRQGQRCVLIIHGRGLNSENRIPVLKESLTVWLTRGRMARMVLAFCSARPADGGLGAVYVLLRR